MTSLLLQDRSFQIKAFQFSRGKSPEEQATSARPRRAFNMGKKDKTVVAEPAAKVDSPIVKKPKLTKEEKEAKEAKKSAKAAKAEGVRESPRLAAAKAAAEAIPEAALEDVDEEAEEAATDGFKVHKYTPPAAPEDETLQCRDCGGDFIFTVGEQEFFKSKGFENKKTRCADCTAAKKSRFGEEGGGGGKGKGKGGGKGKGKGKGDGGGSGGGVCYAFQKGECTRGAACRFSH
jgi:hypothetical protein